MISLYSLTKGSDPKWRRMCSKIRSVPKLLTFGNTEPVLVPPAQSLLPSWSLPWPTLSSVLIYLSLVVGLCSLPVSGSSMLLGWKRSLSLYMVTSIVQKIQEVLTTGLLWHLSLLSQTMPLVSQTHISHQWCLSYCPDFKHREVIGGWLIQHCTLTTQNSAWHSRCAINSC